ncbi:hypothetical protein B0T25DRAFT_30152 [Lasiosphaeria hispida]|uniref:Gfd2/YDR514C-like C-terminal domain-containing protein n=1 Tax=Lasiosphaeria hispida TaxID=260671 RepID=A0AAJ0MK16_9PEZI|nr:hypothetical protein B0T25DRAFT_30152 [Lasiosphaeria hispida]
METTTQEASTQELDVAPNKGLLRDETIALRRLFGYCDNDTSPSPSIPDFLGIKLRKTGLRDVRFLSVDIDALQYKEQVIHQAHIGVSLLDTRILQTSIIGSSNARPETQMIESHHFVVGSPKFSRRKSNRFLFGPFEAMSLADLGARLEAMTLHHNIILVGHGMDRELNILEQLDIDLHPRYIIDTVKAAQYPLQLFYRYSLERLLTEFNIPFCHLHTAGNDAHFILRALLMITVRDAELQLDATLLPKAGCQH